MNTMMMECPRCGFAQPKDQFCASCGLNVDQYLAKPKPILIRLLQNPNLHLALIGIAVVAIIAFIIYSQSTTMSRGIGNLLDVPLSSRDAADPSEAAARARDNTRQNRAQPASPSLTREDQDADEMALTPPATTAAAAAGQAEKDGTEVGKLTASQKLDVSHLEVPREALANLLALAERLGEGTAGRAYFYPAGVKIKEELQKVGRRLSQGRSVPLQAGESMTIETPPTATEAFQFGMFFQMSKVGEKELNLRWESSLVLPQPESPQEATSPNPAVRATLEAALGGTATLAANSLLVIVMDPPNRAPREEYLTRAGEGPWTVFASPEFRAGLTEWVILAQIR